MSPDPKAPESAVKAARSKPTVNRQVALDHLKPRDFSKDWPFGRFDVPPEKFDEFEGMNKGRQDLQLAAVRDLSQLVRDYLTYLSYKRTTQDQVAKKTGLSSSTLSALRNGSSWPSYPTFGVLRAFLPTQEQMQGGDPEEGSGR